MSDIPTDPGFDADGNPTDEYGRALGYCNACGAEALLDTECCDDGEVVPFTDEPIFTDDPIFKGDL